MEGFYLIIVVLVILKIFLWVCIYAYRAHRWSNRCNQQRVTGIIDVRNGPYPIRQHNGRTAIIYHEELPDQTAPVAASLPPPYAEKLDNPPTYEEALGVPPSGYQPAGVVPPSGYQPAGVVPPSGYQPAGVVPPSGYQPPGVVPFAQSPVANAPPVATPQAARGIEPSSQHAQSGTVPWSFLENDGLPPYSATTQSVAQLPATTCLAGSVVTPRVI